MAKAERSRLVQLEEANKLKEKRLKEKKAYDEYIEKRRIQRLKEEEEKTKEPEGLAEIIRLQERKKD